MDLQPLTPTETTAASPTEFVDRHLRPVWRYLRMHGADPADADDLTQEALVLALRKNVVLLEPAAARAFVLRTARHLWLHRLRRRRRDPAAIAVADAADALWSRHADHDGGDELLGRLGECLDHLDGRAGRAIRGWYGIDTETTREALAGELGLQPNGLKMLLQRTRAALRRCLERART